MGYIGLITNPYSIYGAAYISAFVDYQCSKSSAIFTPKKKKLKGYQKK